MVSAEAAVEDAAERTAIPPEVALGLRLGLSPLAWGLAVAALLVAGALAFRFALLASGVDLADDYPADLDFATRVALVASGTTGYTLAVWRWLSRSWFRGLQQLGLAPPDIDPVRDERLIHAIPVSRLRRSRLAGLAGIALFVCTVEGPTALVGAPPGVAWISLHALSYMLFLGVLFFWIAGRSAYFSISAYPARQSLEGLDLDLLDRRPLRTIGGMALRGSLTWVVGLSIASLGFVNPELRFAESLLVAVPLLLVTLAIASAALVLPVRGVHRRIAAHKRDELDRVDAAIRGERDALAGSRLAPRAAQLSLADLIAYRGLVAAASEWPFDARVLPRLGLYLLIPLGSWIAGALVERAVGALFDPP